MIPQNITRDDILKALREIDRTGVPKGRASTKYLLVYQGKEYPPKYTISLANLFANGIMLAPSNFSGGMESNSFLDSRGFRITETSITRKGGRIGLRAGVKRKEVVRRHNERCPECKRSVRKMLEKIYGEVRSNYRFIAGCNPEDFKESPHHETLGRILSALQGHRGHKNFVRSSNLPHCDFYVPNPGFIVEFDESQHFTLPRKICLQNYPDNLKLGFPLEKWASLCEQINAKDNSPVFRDEQRAWYDTLRDFLPALLTLGPTVRLHANEMRWCGLSPDNPAHVEFFRSQVEGELSRAKGCVATVLLKSNRDYSNDARLRVLSQVIETVSRENIDSGVVLFPGGWFSAGKREACAIYGWVEDRAGDVLSRKGRNLIVCLGVDGRETSVWAKDQIGTAINKKGIIALGRKFYPAPSERDYVALAENHLKKEGEYERTFKLKGRKYFICACYDSFGIKHKRIPNFGVDAVLDLIHGFFPKGRGNSGDVYFAKHGLAGASKEWGCPAFGAVVFFERDIPEKWPSGVVWSQGDKSTQRWRYEDNPLKPFKIRQIKIAEGIAEIRFFRW